MDYPFKIQEEINNAKKLYSKSILPGPVKCSCNSIAFKIYFDKNYKTNPMYFTCSNPKCQKKYPVTLNSFFEKFFRQKIKFISEIIKIFLNFDYNVKKAHNYLKNELIFLVIKK